MIQVLTVKNERMEYTLYDPCILFVGHFCGYAVLIALSVVRS